MKFNPDSPEANVPKQKESKLEKLECNIHGQLFFVRYKGELVCPLCMATMEEKDFLPEIPASKRIDTRGWVDYKNRQLPREERSDSD